MECKFCAYDNLENSKFCAQCGKKISYSVPRTYFFFIGYSDEFDTNMVAIVEKNYWEKHQRLDDHHQVGLQKILGQYGIHECMESFFETSHSIEETKQTLNSIGMKEDVAFSEFMMGDNIFYSHKRGKQ